MRPVDVAHQLVGHQALVVDVHGEGNAGYSRGSGRRAPGGWPGCPPGGDWPLGSDRQRRRTARDQVAIKRGGASDQGDPPSAAASVARATQAVLWAGALLAS
jgi:hypothetical protein